MTDPAELDDLLARIRAFVRDELGPLEERFLREPFRALLQAMAEVRTRVKALGMWAPQLPRELGGMGLPLTAFARVSEELGRSPLGHLAFNCQAPDAGNWSCCTRTPRPSRRRAGSSPSRAARCGAASA